MTLGAVLLLPACAAKSDQQRAADAKPVRGGSLVYAIPSEPEGFNPVVQACPQGCQVIARAVFDPLTALNSELKPVPYLAASVSHNADATEWTITTRDGVTFHDGTPLDAAVVKKNLDASRTAPALLAGQLAAIKSVDVVDPKTVRVTMSAPWAGFDYSLAGQAGWMIAPSMIDEGAKAGLKPVGTGPFVLKEWRQGDHLTVTRNPKYWRDNLPYLDQVEFRPIADPASRTAALQRGEVQAMMTDTPEQIAKLDKASDINVNSSTESASTDEWVLNNTEGPTSDLRVRQALAYAFDRASYVKVIGAGVVKPANGPIPPGTIGHLDDTGQLPFDLAKAKALVAQYAAEKGPIKLTITGGADHSKAMQLVQSMWQAAGIQVELKLVDGQVALSELLTGKSQVTPGALPGSVDPADHAVWWSSTNVNPVGAVSLNYARIKDPAVDAALATLRTSTDPAARKKAAEDISRRFAEQTYAIWTYWTVWAVPARSTIHGLTGMQLPDGSTSDGFNQGVHFLTGTWIK